MESIRQIQDFFLIREVQGGNQAAFAQLVHAHDHAVLRLALRITGSPSDAQDIFQEAFLKVYSKLGGFRFECSFSTWLFRIVTNACLDYLRKNRHRREDSSIERSVEGEEYDRLNQVSDGRPANNPEQELLRQELNAHILGALQTLTPRERMVFELKHFEGLKLRTVGEILKTSEASVKTSLFRATRKLRFRLDGFTNGKKSSMKQHSILKAEASGNPAERGKAYGNHDLGSDVYDPNVRTAAGADGENLGH